jgi:hypothetical protein
MPVASLTGFVFLLRCSLCCVRAVQRHYASGVYEHKFAQELRLDDYNPFQLTNHVVVITGWGVTPASEGSIPYWSVAFARNRRGGDRFVVRSQWLNLHMRNSFCSLLRWSLMHDWFGAI